MGKVPEREGRFAVLFESANGESGFYFTVDWNTEWFMDSVERHLGFHIRLHLRRFRGIGQRAESLLDKVGEGSGDQSVLDFDVFVTVAGRGVE